MRKDFCKWSTGVPQILTQKAAPRTWAGGGL
jgi:hypothetical protein